MCLACMASVIRIEGREGKPTGNKKSSGSSIGLPVSYPQGGQTDSYHLGPITLSELHHISGKCVHKKRYNLFQSFLKKQIIMKPQDIRKINKNSVVLISLHKLRSKYMRKHQVEFRLFVLRTTVTF